jgi:hypothetical protein
MDMKKKTLFANRVTSISAGDVVTLAAEGATTDSQDQLALGRISLVFQVVLIQLRLKILAREHPEHSRADRSPLLMHSSLLL